MRAPARRYRRRDSTGPDNAFGPVLRGPATYRTITRTPEGSAPEW